MGIYYSYSVSGLASRGAPASIVASASRDDRGRERAPCAAEPPEQPADLGGRPGHERHHRQDEALAALKRDADREQRGADDQEHPHRLADPPRAPRVHQTALQVV